MFARVIAGIRFMLGKRGEGSMDNIVTQQASEMPRQFQPERKRSHLSDHLRIVVTAPSMANIHSLNPAWSDERLYRATISGDRVPISNRLL
jgi:hypothetical protein